MCTCVNYGKERSRTAPPEWSLQIHFPGVGLAFAMNVTRYSESVAAAGTAANLKYAGGKGSPGRPRLIQKQRHIPGRPVQTGTANGSQISAGESDDSDSDSDPADRDCHLGKANAQPATLASGARPGLGASEPPRNPSPGPSRTRTRTLRGKAAGAASPPT
jgi:hypothetical protein